MKKLTAASGDFCEVTRGNVLSAAESGNFSTVGACKTTRANIQKSLASYAVASQGVGDGCLDKIESAAECGDFSKVSVCNSSRDALKKVVASTSLLDDKHKAWVAKAADSGDFTEVSACAATRESLRKAVQEYRQKSLQTALNTSN